jgi:hypothetical protein
MSNWLDLPNTSNRFIQIYVKGFVDISGGKLIVRNDDVSFNNRIFIGGDSTLNGNLFVNYDVSLNSRLFVLGDTSLNGNLSIGGNISINGRSTATAFDTESDYRIKANVQSLIDTSFTVDLLNPITYINKKLNRQDIGFIAHEVQEQIPLLVTGEKDGEEYQSVNYTGIIGILTKEIQELKKQNNLILERLNKAGI